MTLPQHVAIIPDGNRRWAREKGLDASEGHKQAIAHERIRAFALAAKEIGLQCVSFWAFSTENWKRSGAEKKILFSLIEDAVQELTPTLLEEHVRFRWLGRRDRVPGAVRTALEKCEDETKEHTEMTFVLCVDYGGRDEIVRAVNTAVSEGKSVTEETFQSLLDSQGIPDPDMIVRTSGEHRLSGFYAFPGTYAELFFVDAHFPEFQPEQLKELVQEYETRQRRFGGN